MKFWYQKRAVFAYALMPFSWLYRVIFALRKMLYQLNIQRTTHFSVPVIVVGNITVGGSGKSPLVAWLVTYFRSQGHHPGIVSRGYGGKVHQTPVNVTINSDPRVVGDEPAMLAAQVDCPIIVSPNRVLAAQQLIQKFNCTIVISDDGLQHEALGRDFEIAVLDGERRLGNGLCLPAGPLREPAKCLSYVDCIVTNGRALEDEFVMSLKPKALYLIQDSSQQSAIAAWKGKTVHAVAGIGNPKRFFDQLRSLGMQVIEHPFSDHHAFKASDIQFDDVHDVIMTEKDAVKCRSFAGERHWCLPVRAVLSDEFSRFLDSKLRLGDSNTPSGAQV